MPRKPKFRPEIRRIKLNPEQAVLQCNCWNTNHHWKSSNHRDFGSMSPVTVCDFGVKSTRIDGLCNPLHGSAPLTFRATASGSPSS